MTPELRMAEAKLASAASRLNRIDEEPRFCRQRAARIPSQAWRTYMKAYWEWVWASRMIGGTSPHTTSPVHGDALERGSQ